MPEREGQAVLPAETDVVVVGSGAAALTAAYTAASSGLSVAVIEKTPLLGGISAYSGAGVWLPGNGVLARDGVQDSVEAGLTYFRATVGGRTPAELQDAYVTTGPEMLAFLESSSDIEFAFHPFPDYFDAPGRGEPNGRTIRPVPISLERLGAVADLIRPTSGPDKFDPGPERDQFGGEPEADPLSGGQALIGRLLLALLKTGNAQVFTDTAMTGLVLEDGRVAGVRVLPSERIIRARLGVVVAAGGFECDPGLRRDLQALPGAAWTASPPGSNTGDALAAFEEVGADLDLLEESWWCASLLFPNGYAGFIPIVQRGIFVGPDGRRFADEALPYDQLGRQIRAQMEVHGPAAEFWWVFDSSTETVPGTSTPMPDPQALREAGLWRTGETAEELADAIGVPAEALRLTIETFNGYVREGVDADFGRGDDVYDRFFGVGQGPNVALVSLTQGRLHAVRIVLGDLGTKGGARIGPDAQVLDIEGDPIPGLYAAGGSAASVAGHVYPGPGVPIGSGMVFGYRAARALARRVDRCLT